MYSIRRRLTWSIIGATALLLSAAALFIDARISTAMRKVFDAGLLAKAEALATLVEVDHGVVEFEFADEFMPEFASLTDPQYFRIWVGADRLLEQSKSLQAHELPRFDVALNEHRFADVTLPDGRAGRLVQIVFVPHLAREGDSEPGAAAAPAATGALSPPITLLLARERASLEQLQMANRIAVTAVLAITLVAAGTLVATLVTGGLRPLHELAERMRHIDVYSLRRRLSSGQVRARELAPIQQQLDNMLDRLAQGFEREKRFAGDVAHELRTPVAELRSLAEVATMTLHDREATRAFFDDVRDVSRRMDTLVSNLLELVHADAGLIEVRASDLRLAPLIDGLWPGAAGDHAGTRQLRNEVAGDVVVRSDRGKLEILLRNLLANAAEYSPPGSLVRVATEREPRGLAIRIENPTESLRTEDLQNMRRRFWRHDSARSDSEHAGLGLSLVDALARLLKLQVHLDLAPDGLFVVRVSELEPGRLPPG